MELSLLDSEPPTQKTVEIPRSTGAGHRCLPSQVASWTADRGQHLGLVGHLALLLTVELLALAPFTDLLCEIDPGVGVNAMDRQLDPCPCRLGRVRPYRKLEAPSGYLRGRRAKPLGPGQDSGSIPLGPTRRRPDDQPKKPGSDKPRDFIGLYRAFPRHLGAAKPPTNVAGTVSMGGNRANAQHRHHRRPLPTMIGSPACRAA